MKRAFKLLLVACLLAQMLLPMGAVAAARFNISNLVELAQALNGSVQLSPEKEAEYNLTGSSKLSIADLTAMAREIANPPAESALIGEERAKAIALAEVNGATEADVRKCQLDRENGVQIYDVEIFYDNTEYEYEINAMTGAIISWSMEKPLSPGQTGDIGEDAARQIVLDLIPGATNANFTEFKKDYDNGSAVYEGELRFDGMEYDFEIAASDGDVIKWSVEPYASQPSSTNTPQPGQTPRPSSSPGITLAPTELIGESEATRIALEQVEGASSSNVRKCELDWDDGVRVYEVDILLDGARYEFDVDAYTGEIRASSMKKPALSGGTGDIGENRAKQIVLERIPGASESDFTEFKTGREDGVPVYEGEIYFDGTEYEFELVAATGEVIEWSMDKHTSPTARPTASAAPSPGVTPSPSSSASGLIGAQRAQEIALSNVRGATDANIIECKLDRENGVQVYQVEIRYDGAEYEYDINAANGVIESSSMERPIPRPVPAGDIGEERAKQIVLGLIPGADSSNVLKFKADREDGAKIYEGTVSYDSVRYEFEVLAPTGELIEWKTQRLFAEPTPVATPATMRPTATRPTQITDGIISMSEARQIALQRVPGATDSDIVKCKLDRDDGIQIYEIEIRIGNREYEIEINAHTGAIIDYDEDWDD